MNSGSHPSFTLLRVVLVSLYGYAVFLIMRPFLQPITWAMVIVACSWPAHTFIKVRLAKGSDGLAASLSTTLLSLVLLGILVPLSVEITNESKRLFSILQSVLADSASFNVTVSKFPGLSDVLGILLPNEQDAREQLVAFFSEHQGVLFSYISVAARGVGQLLFNIGVTVFTSFFLYRYGESLSKEIHLVAGKCGGEAYQNSLRVAWVTTGAVMYGVAVAALIQGVLAGIGFYLFGAPLPLLFGGITILLGLIPFGPPLLYLPVSAYLLYSGAPWYLAVGLAVWGVALVSTADNIFRPLFISRATSLPVLLAFFGGLGGIAAFGMIGLFIGPILLALAQEFWKQVARK